MKCPECGSENKDGAVFCKICGCSLNQILTNESKSNDSSKSLQSNNFSPNNVKSSNSTSSNKNLMIAALAIIICAVVIAGALIYFSNNQSANVDNAVDENSRDVNAVSTEDDDSTDKAVATKKDMEIISGSFSTGSSKSDKTYCSVYVGSEHAGENVKISVLYSRDGSNLNNGNIVPKTVDSSGYVSVPSANAFDYYPDNAIVTIYDSSGNVLDTQEVSMSPTSGTQTF